MLVKSKIFSLRENHLVRFYTNGNRMSIRQTNNFHETIAVLISHSRVFSINVTRHAQLGHFYRNSDIKFENGPIFIISQNDILNIYDYNILNIKTNDNTMLTKQDVVYGG